MPKVAQHRAVAKVETEMKPGLQPASGQCTLDPLYTGQGIENPLVPPLNPSSRVENSTALEAAYCKPGRFG